MNHTVTISYLSLIPQRDAFLAESIPLILFDIDDVEASAARDRE